MKKYPNANQFIKKWYVKTGEFRAPKRGEFYLSGAIPEVYDAPNDLTTKFYIMRELGKPEPQMSERGNPILTVNGHPQIEVCLAAHKPGEKWGVILWTYPNVINSAYWHIINLETGRTTQIGKVTRRWVRSGVNYFDRAEAEAKRRNAKASQ